jgi:hypothetical protein
MPTFSIENGIQKYTMSCLHRDDSRHWLPILLDCIHCRLLVRIGSPLRTWTTHSIRCVCSYGWLTLRGSLLELPTRRPL